MKKTEAIALFNTIQEMSRLVGVSRYTIYRWPEELKLHQANMVKGAKAQQLVDETRALQELQG